MAEILADSTLHTRDSGIDETSSPIGPPTELPEGLWVLSRSVGENSTHQRVNVVGPSFTVGRHPSSNLCLSDTTVSGRHAEVLTINRDLFVRDLNSTNGTLLNGRKLQSLTGLRSGDVLHFGSAMFTLQSSTDENMSSTITADVSAEALAQVQFEKLLRRPALRPYYQPILRLRDNARVGFEVLSRSYLLGLETPDKMFRVAATRNVEALLSQICRTEGLRIGESLGNTHFISTRTRLNSRAPNSSHRWSNSGQISRKHRSFWKFTKELWPPAPCCEMFAR